MSMSKENKTSFDILLELVLGYKKHTDKMYEWLDNLKASNNELREALGNPVCIAKKPKPTNFDKITESVESLAEFILKVSNCETNECKDCPLSATSCNTEKGIKEWLQEEAE